MPAPEPAILADAIRFSRNWLDQAEAEHERGGDPTELIKNAYHCAYRALELARKVPA